MKTFIVTGATQGLGLAIAEELAKVPESRVVIAVRDVVKGAKVAASLGANVEVARLDCASLADVRRFVGEWRGKIAGLVNNAGVQLVGETQRTVDGYEETIAVNHLAALELTQGLIANLDGGRVVFIGSGTHDPHSRMARLFGFRGARYTDVRALARGDGDAASARQLGMDRYATSKFLNMVTAIELARRASGTTSFFTLDPGLMAGTGLARGSPPLLRLLWRTVLRWVAPLLPDTSTPQRSARAVAWLLTEPSVTAQNGAVFSFDRRPARRVWELARDASIGRAIVDDSLALLAGL